MTVDSKFFVGVDWARTEHAVCLLDEAGKVIGERTFPHSGEGIASMCTWLLEKSGAEPGALWVAIEVPHGAVVETLLERAMNVCSINPKQLDRFRDRFTVAGAKDDRRDARVLADSLRTDAAAFRRLEVDDAKLIELRAWSRLVDELVGERVRLENRVQAELVRFFPQMLELKGDTVDAFFLDLLELVPTPARARRIHESSVEKIIKERLIRRFKASDVVKVLRQKPLTVAKGTVEAATAHIASLSERLRLLHRQLKSAHDKLDELIAALAVAETQQAEQKKEQCDVDILRSLPGVGRIVLATLLTEASQLLRERNYHALRTMTGVAPVTRRSGKSCVVVMRYARNSRMSRALYHWARVAVQHETKTRTAYAAQRARGHSHGQALRAVGDRLLAVACAMLRNRTTFDPHLAPHRETFPKTA